MDISQPASSRRWLSVAIIVVICIPILLIVLGIAFAGLENNNTSAKFIPSPAVTESAVKAAMEAWMNGQPTGPIEGTKPLIQLVDSQRKPGQVLTSYEILGEVPGNGARCFAVRVQLANPEKQERLRYAVVGIDPLWVFRLEDYEMLCHWAHPMGERKPSETPETPTK